MHSGRRQKIWWIVREEMDHYSTVTEKGKFRKLFFTFFQYFFFQNMELTAQLEQTKKEAVSGGFGPRDKKDASEWIPRGPERVTLHGHRWFFFLFFPFLTFLQFHQNGHHTRPLSSPVQCHRHGVGRFADKGFFEMFFSVFPIFADLGLGIGRVRKDAKGPYRHRTGYCIWHDGKIAW